MIGEDYDDAGADDGAGAGANTNADVDDPDLQVDNLQLISVDLEQITRRLTGLIQPYTLPSGESYRICGYDKNSEKQPKRNNANDDDNCQEANSGYYLSNDIL